VRLFRRAIAIYRTSIRLGGVDEEGNEEPIEAGMLSKQIEKAQKKVEEQNFLQRKHVLEYDDVANEPAPGDLWPIATRCSRASRSARRHAARFSTRSSARSSSTPRDFMEDWDLDGLFTALGPVLPARSLRRGPRPEKIDRISLTDRVTELAIERYNAREAELGEELMGALERFLLLEIIDERWREHLFDMDYLREGIHLRGFAQLDPLVAYKNEAFTLFGDLMSSVWADYTRMIFNAQVNIEGPPPQNGGGRGRQVPPIPAFAPGGSSTRAGRVSYSGGRSAVGAGAIAAAAAAGGVQGGARAYAENGEAEALPVVEQRVLDHEHEVGRNDPCWCGKRQEVQEVSWNLMATAPTESTPQRLAAIREQLKLLADYL